MSEIGTPDGAQGVELARTAHSLVAGAARKVSETFDDEVAQTLLALRALLTEYRGSEITLIAEAALDLADLQLERAGADADARLKRLRGVQTALSRLQGVVQPEQIYHEATQRLCRDCGFDRAILFGVEEDELVAQSVSFLHDGDWADEILEFARSEDGRPQLSEQILETEMLRLRAPAIVPDAQNDPRATRPLVDRTKTVSYVAAPLMPEGRVIGFLHADHFHRGAPVDEVDRDVLWAFAEGCGYAIERTLLRSHLAAEQARLQQIIADASELAHEMGAMQVALDTTSAGALSAATHAVTHLTGASARLTRREREVMDLIVQGESNAGISARLYIAEGTAKQHVKHILRKLGAANRADAVARYLHANPRS